MVSEGTKTVIRSICPKSVLDPMVQAYRALLRAGNRTSWRLWDLWHHVDTCAFAEITSSSVVGSNLAFGSRYEPSQLIRSILKELQIDYAQFGFVDFGSGKGRVLLQASGFPFRAVEGVEFSVELHRVAENNIRRYCRARVRCRDVRSILSDATEYTLPLTPLVIFLFNPFSGPVLAQVMHNIERSAKEHPRVIVIICCGTHMSREDVERIPNVQIRWKQKYSAVYRLADG